MSARENILKAISKNKPALVQAPDMPLPADVNSEELVQQFIKTAQQIGARVVRAKSWKSVKEAHNQMLVGQKYIVNTLEELGPIDTNIDATSDALSLETIDLACIRGQLGVAENGAIWIDENNLPNRLLPFICQHLVLVIEAGQLVSTMHDAYAKLNTFNTGWGAFIAGPSKTADIEQSLVIGAHGARSLVIYLLG